MGSFILEVSFFEKHNSKIQLGKNEKDVIVYRGWGGNTDFFQPDSSRYKVNVTSFEVGD